MNIFFTISGYFTIKYSLKGFIRFFLLIAAFCVINLILLNISGVRFSTAHLISAVTHPLTTRFWFIDIYIFLMITAPLLNIGLKMMGERRLRNTLLLLLIVVFYGFDPHITYTYMQGLCYLTDMYNMLSVG